MPINWFYGGRHLKIKLVTFLLIMMIYQVKPALIKKQQDANQPVLRGTSLKDQISNISFDNDDLSSETSNTSEEAIILLSQGTANMQRRDEMFMKNISF